MDNNFLSIGKAANYLGVSIDTLRRWDKEGKINSQRIDGKNRFFSLSEIQNVKEKNNNLKVSQAAEKLGISASTLRRYEKKGIVKPSRDEVGRRLYDVDLIQKAAGKIKNNAC